MKEAKKITKLQAKIFDEKASNPKNKPEQVIEAVALNPGESLADIGARGGYFSLRFAEIVGRKGRVYALDSKPEFLDYIKVSAQERGLHNVIPVLLTEDKLALPGKGLDLIFMRNVTHHMSSRVTYFRNLSDFLKTDGKIVIIEYKKGKSFTFRGLFGHHVPKEIIR